MRGGLSVILVVCQSVCERGGAGTDALLVFLPSIKWLNAALYDTLRGQLTLRCYHSHVPSMEFAPPIARWGATEAPSQVYRIVRVKSNELLCKFTA